MAPRLPTLFRAAILTVVAFSFLAGGHAAALAATDRGLGAGRDATVADVAGVRQVRTLGDATGQQANSKDGASNGDDSDADTDDSESTDGESTDSEDSEDSEEEEDED